MYEKYIVTWTDAYGAKHEKATDKVDNTLVENQIKSERPIQVRELDEETGGYENIFNKEGAAKKFPW